MEIEGLPGSWLTATYSEGMESIYDDPNQKNRYSINFMVTLPNGKKVGCGRGGLLTDLDPQ